jgi:hypothetical protein
MTDHRALRRLQSAAREAARRQAARDDGGWSTAVARAMLRRWEEQRAGSRGPVDEVAPSAGPAASAVEIERAREDLSAELARLASPRGPSTDPTHRPSR